MESEIEIRTGPEVQTKFTDDYVDPFLQPVETLKSFGGISPNLRRKGTRISKAHTGAEGVGSKKLEGEFENGYGYFGVISPPYNLDYLAKLNEISSPHFAAVEAKVANIVGLGYDFVESEQTNDLLEEKEGPPLAKFRKRLRGAKRDLMLWLDSCNDEDEFAETLDKVLTDFESTGNGYFEIGRTVDGRIKYIGHIPSTSIRVRKDRDGFVQIIGRNAVFFRNFGDLKTKDPVGADPRPNEIIHIKKYSPTNNFYGIPDIVSAKVAIAGNEFAGRFNLDYFENKAVPRYIITLKGGTLSANSEKKLLEFFEVNLKGQSHRTLYVPLPADTPENKVEFTMKPVEANIQDSSFNNYKKGNMLEILMAHRVPISKVGVAEGVSLAMARDMDKTFKEQVCRPTQRIVEKKLSKIFREITDAFTFRLNELTLTDEDTLSKIDERYLRMQVIVPNEVRARLGRPGREGGDKPVELKPQQAADQRATAGKTRQRDSERSASSPDVDGESRNPKGEGRVVQ